jgi:long-chain fatty acid transport protein
MKKLFVFLCVASLIAASASPLFAGGADNKTNWSAEYIRTLNRNAATDSADIVMYNPAGVMKMENGLYGNVSAHYIAKDYNNRIDGIDFDQDEPSVVPGLFAVYKMDRWAGYFGVSNVLGGGEISYGQGNLTTLQIGLGIADLANSNPLLIGAAGAFGPGVYYTQFADQNLDGEQVGLGYTFGGAYQINDMFSVALAARYVDTTLEFKGSATVSALSTPAALGGANDPLLAATDFEETADGWGYILGVNITPNDQWNIGIRYDSKIDLDYELDVKQDEISTPGGPITDLILPKFGRIKGQERERNLPAIFAIGASYQLNPKIRLETNLTYYLNESAGFDDIPGTSRDESDVDNGFDLGIACEYAFTETVKGSVGYLYTKTGVDAENMTPWLPELDAHSLGAGAAWTVMPNMVLNFGIGHVFYQSDDFVYSFTDYAGSTTQHQVEYEKDITFLAFGIQYKFM